MSGRAWPMLSWLFMMRWLPRLPRLFRPCPGDCAAAKALERELARAREDTGVIVDRCLAALRTREDFAKPVLEKGPAMLQLQEQKPIEPSVGVQKVLSPRAFVLPGLGDIRKAR